MNRTFSLLSLLVLLLGGAPLPSRAAEAAKPAAITRIDPTFWWVGMKNPKLQLLVHGPGIGASTASLNYAGVTLDGTQKLENPNYLLVNLSIGTDAKPGKLPLEFKGAKKVKYEYELRARTTPGDKSKVQGINSSDFVYLLMPDRFANGDPSNDVVKSLQETKLDRGQMYARHGGDLKGIEDHFGYLKELGVTAIWPTPIVENDEPKTSYHGYALTDFYAVDPRYGSNDDYVRFVQRAHQQGLKVVHDVVLNHMGTSGYLVKDAPAKDWFHQWPTFTRSNFRDAAFNDPYVSQSDRKQFGEGWFDQHMADLNQTNPLVSTYLIQNFLWWVEYTGLDGYRVDTYTYSDRKFLMDWGKALLDEYPQLGMFAETWVQGTAQQAYFARNILPEVDGFKSNMPGVLDFQLQYAINEALTRDAGWTEGISKLYYTLQADWLYEDPARNVVFLDNHDMSRFFSVIGEDLAKYKMGLAWLLTVRGTPQLYYGTEVLMKNYSNPDGKVREDFPGGWAGDKVNLFTAVGRTGPAAEAFTYVSKLANYRKTHPVLHTGKLMHFIPDGGVYTYFRYNDAGETVMVMMNTNKDEKTVDTARMAERLSGYTAATDVVTGATLTDLKSVKIPGRTAWVLELKK
ncbi:glycoside hydrolase family 13 protein [Hymenobacter busanensis]|uniref:Glycoside hydrolase family 13 protein n=1 Tax=Hymenobacter busanensis TaxID=2607656 RepID=A0A7L4ZY86_9BACT|nr:glycoside hydrolase family 13 protein [Hymenobacter busanensis]KAA9333094.1 glycoside hydrolase family 13 protein [Hymenobacter busanensis]QHJ08231.1 alpha-amylase [Hymenobacter busanensis]